MMNSLTSPTAEQPQAHRAPSPAAEPVAIIGMSCRFPGARDVAAFWQLLRDGVDAIGEVPAERWDADAFYDAAAATPGKTVTRWGGFLHNVDRFDAAFFGISPREAAYIDPQQRLLLEVAWEALEHAGQTVAALAESATGVFIGISGSDYGALQQLDPQQIARYSGIGSAVNIAAGRLAYQFDLRGPCITVDTAQSSSLVAVHLACQSLQTGESTLALAGGVRLMLSPAASIAYSQMQVLASDGRCKTFDSRANGFVPGEGCGVVVLKRLSNALADNDPILAVIRGTAINQDGRSSGLSAPNPAAQQAVIRLALQRGGVEPSEISYVETHGSGTPLGDPIEVASLRAVLGTTGASACLLGAVKTNIGHLDTAGGVAGLIKTVLALRHGLVPANLHFQTLNPHIELDESRLRIATSTQPWPSDVQRRIAGISSFGWSGTNAHVVVEAAPAAPVAQSANNDDQLYLVPISARHPAALHELVRRYHALLSDPAAPSVRDIAYSAAVRRTHHDYRIALSGTSTQSLAEQAQAFLEDMLPAEPVSPQPQLVFVFPGQGSQWRGMAQDLLRDEPVFRASIDACAAAFRPYVSWDLHQQINEPCADPPIDMIQPTLFAVAVGLCALWRSWGVVPDAVIGHSMGEVAAAYVAGALTLDEAARVACLRSQLQRRCSGRGAMAMADLSEAEAVALLADYPGQLSIAANNGPRATVISGDPAALDALIARLEARQVFCRRVNVDIAAHSQHMEPLLEPLRAALTDLRPQPTQAVFYSSVTGAALPGTALDGAYWARNLREPVRFGPATHALIDAGHYVFIEMSAHPLLVQSIKSALTAAGQTGLALPSLRRHEAARSALRGTLAVLYSAGYALDWARIYAEGGRCVELPAYPWQRERFWIDGLPMLAAAGTQARRATAQTDPADAPNADTSAQTQPDHLADWLYSLDWEPQQRPADPPRSPRNEQWLIFADTSGTGHELAADLRARGADCVLVTTGTNGLERHSNGYRLDPAQPDAFRQLFQSLSSGAPCRNVIFLWSLSPTSTDATPADDPTAAQRYGLLSALHLVQALARSGWRDAPRLWLVTRGAQSVAAEQPSDVAHAPLWGFGRSVMYEHPELQCSLLDLPAAGLDDEAAVLATELLAQTAENQVALRRAGRYVARLDHPTAAPSSGAHSPATFANIRRDATYLIVGLGNVGLALARWLADRGARSLALIGRREPSAAAQQVLDELGREGVSVSVYQADLARRDQLAAVLDAIGRTDRPLRGVFHAAGASDQRSLVQFDADQLSATLAAHVAGSWHLHSLTQHIPLDYFALCSSVAGMLGATGQSSQAAGSSFMAALAAYRRGRGLPALNIAWSAWSDGDVAAASSHSSAQPINQGLKRISAAEGIGALERMLQQNVAQIGVMPLNLRQWQQSQAAAATLPLFDRLRRTTVATTEHSLRAALLAAEPEQRAPMLETHLTEQVCAILHLAAFRIDRHKPLGTLGLDSLMALDLRNRLEDSLGLEFPVTLIWNYQTIAALSAHLAEKLTPPLEAPPAPAAPEPTLEEEAALALLFDEINKYSLDELREAFAD